MNGYGNDKPKDHVIIRIYHQKRADMKRTELMVGDWVNRNPFSQELEKYVRVTSAMINYSESDLARITPIPLTADILEKNRFVWTAYGIDKLADNFQI